MRRFFAATALAGAALLASCGLYMHDPSLQDSAESTRTLVSQADLSQQLTNETTGAADLAKRQEAAVVGFYIMRRNQQLFGLLQPDVLEANAFADAGAEASYIKKSSGYGRNPADLATDVATAINCRLDDLLAAHSPTCAIDRTIVLRDKGTLTGLRNASFPEIQFANEAGLDVAVQDDMALLTQAIDQAAQRNPGQPEDPRGKITCADVTDEIVAQAKAAVVQDDSDAVAHAFKSVVVDCQNVARGHLAAQPVLQSRDANSAFAQVTAEIAQLRATREQQQIDGFRLAAKVKSVLKDIAAAQGPGPAAAALQQGLQKVQGWLKQAEGAAKLAGLHEVADQTDALLQIELTNSATGSAAAPTAPTGTAAPSDPDALAATGQAVVTLATDGAAAIDAYKDQEPAARAQSLIIARAVVTQQTEVAALEADLVETKLRLLIAKRDFMINEVHLLAEAGLYLARTELGSEQVHLALVRLAGAWDSGRIEEEAITYRIFAAERDTSIRISASNAKNLQAAVLAATDQIVAYSKGGLTKEMIADTFAKLFIGGALLK